MDLGCIYLVWCHEYHGLTNNQLNKFISPGVSLSLRVWAIFDFQYISSYAGVLPLFIYTMEMILLSSLRYDSYGSWDLVWKKQYAGLVRLLFQWKFPTSIPYVRDQSVLDCLGNSIYDMICGDAMRFSICWTWFVYHVHCLKGLVWYFIVHHWLDFVNSFRHL